MDPELPSRRLELHALLVGLLGTDKVYFQPPANVEMKYPAIVYRRDIAETQFADNNPYRHTKRYEVTVIDPDPDNEILEKLAALRLCTFSRHFVADNLNHDVYNLYF